MRLVTGARGPHRESSGAVPLRDGRGAVKVEGAEGGRGGRSGGGPRGEEEEELLLKGGGEGGAGAAAASPRAPESCPLPHE